MACVATMQDTGAWPEGVLRVGVDLVRVAEVREALARYGARYLTRCYSAAEIAWCQASTGMSAERLAARFAAKEAALKVLEPSEGDGPVPDFRAIEVIRRRSGACALRLDGAAAVLARRRGIAALACSLAHEGEYAAAVVLGTKVTGSPRRGKDAVAEIALPGARARERVEAATRPRRSSTQRVSPRGGQADNKGAITMDESIRQILAQHARLQVDPATLADDADLYQAGLTSHSSVSVMLALEDEFDIEFPQEMLRKKTFQSIAAIREALSGLGAAAVR